MVILVGGLLLAIIFSVGVTALVDLTQANESNETTTYWDKPSINYFSVTKENPCYPEPTCKVS